MAITHCQGLRNEMVSEKIAGPKLLALSRPAKSLAAN